VILRSQGNAYNLAPQLRRTVEQLDPSLPVEQVSSLDEVVGQSYKMAKVPAELLVVYSLASLLIAMLGIYAALAYSAIERNREFALRIALGATRPQIRSLVLRGSFLTAALGLVIGSAGAFFAVRLIRAMLFGVAPFDPISIALALFVILTVTFLSAIIPARRAAVSDPMQVLRNE